MKPFQLAASLSCAALLAPLPTFAASQQEILEAAQQQKQPLLETLETLVNIDSGTGYTEGLNKVAGILEQRLERLGAEIETRPAPKFGGKTLIGTLNGDGDQDIMLMIHYDTVFNEGEVDERPFRTEEGRGHGPGIADAKGGVAVILHALKILEELDFKQYGTLTVVFNPDEEKGSLGSRNAIQELAKEQDTVLVFEPALGEDDDDAVTVVTKGINYAFLDVEGRASHAGSAPEQGRNAIMELAHQLLQLDELGNADKKTTLNWTIVDGGTKRNIIPEQAHAEGDMRYFDAGEYDRVVKQANDIIKDTLIDGTQVDFHIDKGRPPMPDNPQTQALAKQAQKIYSELDRDLKAVEIGGGTDAAYAYSPDSDTPAVLESLGLVGGRYHSSDEFIVLDSIVPRLYLTTRMIMDLSQQGPEQKQEPDS